MFQTSGLGKVLRDVSALSAAEFVSAFPPLFLQTPWWPCCLAGRLSVFPPAVW